MTTAPFHQTEDLLDGANQFLVEDRAWRPDKVKREKKLLTILYERRTWTSQTENLIA